MLAFIKTDLRRKLLAYTFTHCDESFYVRQIAILIDEDPGNLSRELRKLEQEGVYVSSTKGNVKFYSVNKSYLLFKELKKIVFKTEGVEGSLKKAILKYKGVSSAFIYGSYAKNKEKSSSDVDVVVVGDFNRNKFTNDVRGLEFKLNREINFTIYGEDDFEKEKGEKGSFLNLVSEGKVIFLKGEKNDK